LFLPEPTAISNPELGQFGGSVQKGNSPRKGIHQEPSLVEYGNGDDDSPGTRNGIPRNEEFLGNRGPEKRGTGKGNAQPRGQQWQRFKTLCKGGCREMCPGHHRCRRHRKMRLAPQGHCCRCHPTAHPKRRSLATTVARVGGADPLRTKRPRTGRGQRRQQNGGYIGDDNAYTHNDTQTIT
jgi:hypothetical protein